MIIFESNRGKVVRLDDPAAQASIGFVNINQPISYSTTRSIITRLTISQQTNVQFLHTLGSHIYIYVFGDRIGQMSLSGISFNAPCELMNPDGTVDLSEIGIAKMLDWYKQNRVSETGQPIRVAIGNRVIEGFVLGSTYDTIEPEAGLIQWGITLNCLPDYVSPVRPASTQPASTQLVVPSKVLVPLSPSLQLPPASLHQGLIQ
jgi:hypothetical protein